MYAVKTVIVAIGNLKREQKDLAEDQICLRVLKNVNIPQFLKNDLQLFNSELIFISKILNNTQIIFFNEKIYFQIIIVINSLLHILLHIYTRACIYIYLYMY